MINEKACVVFTLNDSDLHIAIPDTVGNILHNGNPRVRLLQRCSLKSGDDHFDDDFAPSSLRLLQLEEEHQLVRSDCCMSIKSQIIFNFTVSSFKRLM